MAAYIERQTNYDVRELTETVRRGIDTIGFDLSGRKSAVIKVNIVQARQPQSGVVTHPAVTEAVIRLLREAGIDDISILEGPALGVDVQNAFKMSGYLDLAERLGVDLINAFESPRTRIDVGYGYHDLPTSYDDADLPKWYSGYMTVPSPCVEADLYVSIPKMKTHNRAKITLGLKSQWGLLDVQERKDYHRTGLHEPIAYLARGMRPHLTIIDGIIGLEGNGPILGVPRRADLIVVGDDVVETDIVGTQLMGHDPKVVEHIIQAIELGLGTWETDVRGVSIADAVVNFEAANLDLKKSLNFYLWRNPRACHLCDDSFLAAFKSAKRNPKYWMFFVKLGYFMLFRRIDALRGRGMKMPELKNGGKVILTGDCIRDIVDEFQELPENVIFNPGCPPEPEDIIKAIIRM